MELTNNPKEMFSTIIIVIFFVGQRKSESLHYQIIFMDHFSSLSPIITRLRHYLLCQQDNRSVIVIYVSRFNVLRSKHVFI